MKKCPYCAEEILQEAIVCKHCKTDLVNPKQDYSPGVAMVLSLFIPGLGQLYKKQIFNGIAWFFTVVIGYAFLIIPGVILHLFCIMGAGMNTKKVPITIEQSREFI